MQDYDWWLRHPPEEEGRAVGRVSVALNQSPLTWKETGLDPNDPDVADKWTKAVIYGIQGYNPEQALMDAAKQKGIKFKSIYN